MRSTKSVFGGTPLIVVITILSCLAALGITAFSSRKQKATVEESLRQKQERLRGAELRIKNLTHGLTVVKLEKDVDQDLIRVILRNDYPKTITAYEVAVGSGTIQSQCITEETDDRTPIHPGDIREEVYPLQDDVDSLGIRVLAVIFEDRSSDGELQYVQEMQDYRHGLILGIRHSLELLNETIRAPKAELPQALAKLQRELSPVSQRAEGTLPHFVELGMRDATARIARDITSKRQILLRSEQQKDSQTARRELTKIVSRLQGTLSKL